MCCRVNHVSTSSTGGGAAIAARRLHDACLTFGLKSRMTVADAAVDPPIERFVRQRGIVRMVQRELARHLQRRAAGNANGLVSLAMARSGLGAHLNRQPRQIVNLHWVNFDFISIAEIGRIRHPLVWTMHDMWPISGAEHYSETDDWRDGYRRQKSGSDLNQWVWQRKRRHWRRPFHIVTPSRWLAECARDSALTGGWPVRIIPNPIDTDVWTPMPRAAARAGLDLPVDVPMVLFGAMGGGSDPRKGFVHLREALLRLHAEGRDLQLLVFGGAADAADLPFKVHSVGAIDDPETLRMMYAAADVFALPSRQDNLPNVGVEALACGTPIVGFDIGGLPDLVAGCDLGYLARPYDAQDLAQGMARILDRRVREASDATDGLTPMARAARDYAVDHFAMPVVAARYNALYEELWHSDAR